MSSNSLGTILPTKKSEKAGDAAFLKNQKAIRYIESTLGQYDRINHYGEIRFYDGPSRYAVVSRQSLKVLWFEFRNDGWYSVR